MKRSIFSSPFDSSKCMKLSKTEKYAAFCERQIPRFTSRYPFLTKVQIKAKVKELWLKCHSDEIEEPKPKRIKAKAVKNIYQKNQFIKNPGKGTDNELLSPESTEENDSTTSTVSYPKPEEVPVDDGVDDILDGPLKGCKIGDDNNNNNKDQKNNNNNNNNIYGPEDMKDFFNLPNSQSEVSMEDTVDNECQQGDSQRSDSQRSRTSEACSEGEMNVIKENIRLAPSCSNKDVGFLTGLFDSKKAVDSDYASVLSLCRGLVNNGKSEEQPSLDIMTADVEELFT